MDILLLREFLHSDKGQWLLSYLTDFMVECSLKTNMNAEWIRGMGMMIHHLKQIDEQCRRENEINRRLK